MSDYERNKGVLYPIGVSEDDISEDEINTYLDNGFELIKGELYRVDWEIRKDYNMDQFVEVSVNKDGSISFHTYHYNGGAHWTELVEVELNK